MNILFPRNSEPLDERGAVTISRSWSRFFADLWAAIGLSASSPQYADLFIDPLAMNQQGSGVVVSAISGTLFAARFPDASTNSLYFTARLPNSYRPGTSLQPYIEWAPVSAAAGSVVWVLEYEARGNAEVFGSPTSLTETATSPGATGQVSRVEFDEVPASGLGKGDIVRGRIARTGAAAGDTYAADAAILSLGFKYVVDGVGAQAAHPV